MPFKINPEHVVYQVFNCKPGFMTKGEFSFGKPYLIKEEFASRSFYCGIIAHNADEKTDWIYFKDLQSGWVFVQERKYVLNDPSRLKSP